MIYPSLKVVLFMRLPVGFDIQVWVSLQPWFPLISEFPTSVWIAEKHRPAHLQRECQAAKSSSIPSSTASRNNFSRHESGPVQQIQKCNANMMLCFRFTCFIHAAPRQDPPAPRSCASGFVWSGMCNEGLAAKVCVCKVLSFFRFLFPSLFFSFSLSLLSVSPSRFLYFFFFCFFSFFPSLLVVVVVVPGQIFQTKNIKTLYLATCSCL